MIRQLKDSVKCWLFRTQGMKPWSRGYAVYKWQQIQANLQPGQFDAAKLKDGYGFRIDDRVVEYPWLLSRLPEGAGKFLDAGSTLNYDLILKQPKLKSKQVFIATLAPENQCYWNDGISYVYEDLRSTCFRDNYFDWVASISTVEHIGLDNTMLYTAEASKKEDDRLSFLTALQEYYRILKPGGTLYLSMPFGKHQNFGWFQIFDADMVDSAVSVFDGSTVVETIFKYEADGWKVSNREEAKDATYFDYHTSKEPHPLTAAASGALVCLEVTKSK